MLEDSDLEKNRIDEIVLVCGSARLRKVQQLTKDLFNGKEPTNRGANPKEAVACGTAGQAGILSDGGGQDLLPLHVTALTVGTETVGGCEDQAHPLHSFDRQAGVGADQLGIQFRGGGQEPDRCRERGARLRGGAQ